MSDLVVFPRLLQQSSTELASAGRMIRSSAERLHAARQSTRLNRADPQFSVGSFTSRSQHTTSELVNTANGLRDLGDHVQLTLTRILAADDGGAAASTDPASGYLLQPGVGFGPSAPGGSEALGSLPVDGDTLNTLITVDTVTSMADSAPKIPATARALLSERARPWQTVKAMARAADEAPGLTDIALRRGTRPAAALQRTVQASRWADEAAHIGGKISTGIAAAKSVGSTSRATPFVKFVGNNALTGVGAVLDAKAAHDAFDNGDTEAGAIYTARAFGGVVSVIPGGQVVGLSIVGATYVVEYREELWDGFVSTADFAEELFG